MEGQGQPAETPWWLIRAWAVGSVTVPALCVSRLASHSRFMASHLISNFLATFQSDGIQYSINNLFCAATNPVVEVRAAKSESKRSTSMYDKTTPKAPEYITAGR